MSGDNYGNCDVVYDLTSNLEQGSPVYLHTQKHRVLALYGDKWACRGTIAMVYQLVHGMYQVSTYM